MPSSPHLTHPTSRALHQAPAAPTLALIFPGQGAQHVGMAAHLCQTSAAARQLFQDADSLLQTPLSRLCFDGPDEELRQTANAQPAILVTALAFLAAALERGDLQRRPAFLAGHSLGEYTALVAAGALSFADALPLVRQRGLLMQQAGEGAMAAVLGLSEDVVQEICRLSGAEPCNYNAPAQLVIGGPPDAVAVATALAKDRGSKVLPLNVSGAFHTSLMTEAARNFARLVDEVPLTDPVIPVVGNVDARPLNTAAALRDELKRQMTSPVLWRQSVTAMAQAGVTNFLETGPGRVLTGLVSRTVAHAEARSLDAPVAAPNSRHA